jgi:rfaE bifunctional protein kinase chain/domain
MNTFDFITRPRLCGILEKIKNTRAAVFGDICLDIYWLADMCLSELSRETPHFALPVVEERISLGGGGNVSANMAALKPKSVTACGAAGTDWRGSELARLISGTGIENYIVSRPNLTTNAFCKPLRRGLSDIIYEDPRLDFANIKPLRKDVENGLIAALDKIAAQTDVLCVCDQLPPTVYGAVTDGVREHICKLAENGLTVIADSRDKIGLFMNCIIKPNEIEAKRAAGTDDYIEAALKLSKNHEVIMTAGEKGSFYANKGEIVHIPARRVKGDIDTVGAGDTFLSAFALAAAAGADRLEAAFFAGLCGEITVQKLGTTGTAAPDEVLARYDREYGDENV